ncbi:MAG TPA: hypothetical protein VFO29_12790 [Candidatus Rubrimentiphilum sp.]|nr:hypothetical protein [Candidatus Rubrimentiphilum sp.]
MAAAAVLLLCLRPAGAGAIPVFARQYGLSCQACHTTVPQLNKFGQAFRDSGYRWPAATPARGTVPIAMKINLAYTSAADPTGLPKAVVDEIEFLSFGPVGKHLAYRVEQYWVDGGRPGRTRDAFLEYKSDPLSSWHGSGAPVLDVQLGQFTLPLPNDPETLRPTENHYAIFDQTVGDNSFNLFDDRIGLNAGFGNRLAEVRVLAMKDRDTMLSARVGPAAFSLWTYQYRGERILGSVTDDFVRRGVALTSTAGKAQTSFLLQTGTDRSPFGLGDAASSSGGYLQEEWAFSDRWIGTARYDGLNGPDGFMRSTTLSLSYRPYNRARWTLEDVIQTQPQTTRTLNAAWLFAY